MSERIIDELHARSNWPQKKKPRTYREIARKAYLSLIKLRRPSNTAIAVPAMEFGAKIEFTQKFSDQICAAK